MSIREQYVFITNKNEDMQCIGIRKGKFEGVVYKYGKVSLDKDATRKAIDIVMRIKSKVPTRLVTLNRDLKVLTKNEIWQTLDDDKF